MIDYSFVPRWSSRLVRSAFLCLLVVGVSACSRQNVKPEEKPVLQEPTDLTQLEGTIDRQKARIMELELRLLAMQAEIERLSSAQEQAIQEVVRVKAKLRSHNSKAETVANLAEVKLAIQGAQARDLQDGQVEGLARARQYVAMSEAALQESNYDGASYLISQAKSSLHISMAASAESPDGNSNMHRFAQPVRLTVTQRSNVRAGPGTHSKVLHQLDSGVSVLATGYRDLWVRVQSEGKPDGWIHYSLLEASI